MATIHDQNWHSDDEPDDADYALPDDDGSSESHSDERPSKKAKVSEETEIESALSKEAVEDLWTSFNEAAPAVDSLQARKKIKIIKTIKFAGKVTNEEIEVWEDSDEAKSWLNGVPAEADVSTTVSNSALKKGPNKPRKSLASMSASLTKPTKITTLEKSKLDWDRFVTDQRLEEDLERSKKSKDNFLDREDFKRRTEDKRLAAVDQLRR